MCCAKLGTTCKELLHTHFLSEEPIYLGLGFNIHQVPLRHRVTQTFGAAVPLVDFPRRLGLWLGLPPGQGPSRPSPPLPSVGLKAHKDREVASLPCVSFLQPSSQKLPLLAELGLLLRPSFLLLVPLLLHPLPETWMGGVSLPSLLPGKRHPQGLPMVTSPGLWPPGSGVTPSLSYANAGNIKH